MKKNKKWPSGHFFIDKRKKGTYTEFVLNYA